MNYPARGKMSEDGKYYTHADGSVHRRIKRPFRDSCGDKPCSLYDKDGTCPPYFNQEPCRFVVVEGAYVNTDEEREACDMARAMIKRHCLQEDGCESCYDFHALSCPARAYLFKHHQPDAWEVKP